LSFTRRVAKLELRDQNNLASSAAWGQRSDVKMQAIKLRAEVGTDRHIELDLPPEIPQGTVEIIILYGEPPSGPPASSLRAFSEEIDKLPHSRRTKEEIDRYVAEERASWD
jgi:hypothetical protein